MFPPFGMGMMGMPMPLPLPMMTPMMPVPGVMPGVPGMGWYNSLPGRFGRDMLGRDFAGPGGVGSSQPYRPPDPAALPPMPFGLPFIARPGQEGFDAYGRMLPPELPEGPTPSVPAASQPQAPPAAPAPAAGPSAGGQAPPAATRDMTMTSESMGTFSSGSSTGRPEQPACFERPPAAQDSFFRYDEFEAFSLPSQALNHPWELHLPRELVSHDVNEEDWAKFIEDLARESIQQATHDWSKRNKGVLGKGPRPVLTDAVHSLLLSWAVAFFAPRGIRVYAAADGKRIIPPPLDPGSSRRGYSAANEWSDSESDTLDGDSTYEDESRARRDDMYLPRRERQIRRDERARMRRRERRRRREEMEREGGNSRAGWSGAGGYQSGGEWEVHFVCATPTVWTPGARPRTYGEPVVRVRR
ncbi:hypothetical protein DB88DRAFT_164213 [Papiliotrema laurentii]|uniref:Uncharacterized protein n=1 Tax=Papiliotrema laurentii TaxID=5418 RepID=A0AAD9FUL4_PAPLA|nr:hypothetical protein DB88DRAFT_164213 [Papiliotrema laurentii]